MSEAGVAKRILIFNVNWLGDVLFSTATIRNVRRNYPDSYIACAIPSRCYPVLKGNPYLDEVIIFDERDRHKGMLAKLGFISLLKSRRFDTVFLLHRSFSRALICRLAGIEQRVGHYTRKRAFLLTRKVPMPKADSMHRIDFYLNVIEKSGLRVEDRYLDFIFSPEEENYVDNFLKRNMVDKKDFLAVLNPGGNWTLKRWPPDYWARLADGLIGEMGAKVVISGSISDLPLAERIKGVMKEKPLVAGGVFNIKHLAALAKRADLFVTADTGPLHIANAVGAKKIIAIFGPTAREITGPYPDNNVVILQKNVGCSIPCYKVHCRDNRCMKAVVPEEVLAEARKTRKA